MDNDFKSIKQKQQMLQYKLNFSQKFKKGLSLIENNW